jgi:hypothetical protein
VLFAVGEQLGTGTGTGTGVILRWDGAAWIRDDVYSAGPVLDVVAASAADAYAVSAGEAFHFDGLQWTRLPETGATAAPLSSDVFRAALLDAAGRLVTVGPNGTVLRWRRGP